jgi:hypothetical protein
MKQAQERLFCPIIPAFVVKRSMRAAIAFRLFLSLRRETLPTRATGLAFEGPNDFVRYPTAIKSTGLGAHGLARHNAVTFRWVKGIPACHFREGLGGFGIAPSEALVLIAKVLRLPLPFAVRGAIHRF